MEREFFDNAFEKAKSAFETAYKKTGEVVNIEKLKFNISSIKSKREKLYAKLGKNVFENFSENVTELDENKEIFDEINELNKKIEDLNNEINYAKSKRTCPSCNACVEENATFCSKCGAKLIFDSSENENE